MASTADPWPRSMLITLSRVPLLCWGSHASPGLSEPHISGFSVISGISRDFVVTTDIFQRLGVKPVASRTLTRPAVLSADEWIATTSTDSVKIKCCFHTQPLYMAVILNLCIYFRSYIKPLTHLLKHSSMLSSWASVRVSSSFLSE